MKLSKSEDFSLNSKNSFYHPNSISHSLWTLIQFFRQRTLPPFQAKRVPYFRVEMSVPPRGPYAYGHIQRLKYCSPITHKTRHQTVYLIFTPYISLTHGIMVLFFRHKSILHDAVVQGNKRLTIVSVLMQTVSTCTNNRFKIFATHGILLRKFDYNYYVYYSEFIAVNSGRLYKPHVS